MDKKAILTEEEMKFGIDLTKLNIVDDTEDMEDALADVSPIVWDGDVLSGKKKVVVDASSVSFEGDKMICKLETSS